MATNRPDERSALGFLLDPRHSPGVRENLTRWLEARLEATRDALVAAEGLNEVMRLQGAAQELQQMLRAANPREKKEVAGFVAHPEFM